METLITEQEDIPNIAPYELEILWYLKEGYSIRRIAQVLHKKEVSVKAIRCCLCTQFDFYRPTRGDWLIAYQKCMRVRKAIPTKDVCEVLRDAYKRSDSKTQEVLLEIAEQLYMDLKEGNE